MVVVLVRWGVLEDAAAITDIHVQGWKLGYRGMLPQETLDGIEASQRLPRWTATLEGAERPRRGTLVVEDEGALLGFADLRPSGDADGDPDKVGEVRSFYVLPSRWRQGVGSLLMAESVRRLELAGFAEATLWVHDANGRAMRFYERTGWTPDGATNLDTVRGHQLTEVRYRRALGSPSSAARSAVVGPTA